MLAHAVARWLARAQALVRARARGVRPDDQVQVVRAVVERVGDRRRHAASAELAHLERVALAEPQPVVLRELDGRQHARRRVGLGREHRAELMTVVKQSSAPGEGNEGLALLSPGRKMGTPSASIIDSPSGSFSRRGGARTPSDGSQSARALFRDADEKNGWDRVRSARPLLQSSLSFATAAVRLGKSEADAMSAGSSKQLLEQFPGKSSMQASTGLEE